MILLGYVPQPHGRAAVSEAIRFARLTNEPIAVVNSASGDQQADTSFASEEEMARVMSEIQEAGIEAELHHMVSGHTGADTVLELADSVSASLIVIGVRRRSPTGKALFGSNSQNIILTASCPVLTVKAETAVDG